MDLDLALKFAAFAVPLVGAAIGGWALMRDQGRRNALELKDTTNEMRATYHLMREEAKEADEQRRASIEALSSRLDEKLHKAVEALSSVQSVAEESMRQVRAAWGRIEEESRMAAREREERARLEEQLKSQKELIADLKRTQELNLADVRRAISEHRNS